MKEITRNEILNMEIPYGYSPIDVTYGYNLAVKKVNEKKSKRDKPTRVDESEWSHEQRIKSLEAMLSAQVGQIGEMKIKIESYSKTHNGFILDVQRCVNENKTETTQSIKNLLDTVFDMHKRMVKLESDVIRSGDMVGLSGEGFWLQKLPVTITKTVG